jgi:hypothetical protein
MAVVEVTTVPQGVAGSFAPSMTLGTLSEARIGSRHQAFVVRVVRIMSRSKQQRY